jgi:hypothetical protein
MSGTRELSADEMQSVTEKAEKNLDRALARLTFPLTPSISSR